MTLGGSAAMAYMYFGVVLLLTVVWASKKDKTCLMLLVWVAFRYENQSGPCLRERLFVTQPRVANIFCNP